MTNKRRPRKVSEIIKTEMPFRAFLEYDENGDGFVMLKVPIAEKVPRPSKPVTKAIADKLIPRIQFMEEMKITETTFWRWAKKGLISVERIGRKVFVKSASIPGMEGQ